MRKAALIIILILILDQILKIWVKTHMYMGESIGIFGNWFIIHFTENEGMAFGMKLGGEWGKLLLSLFRIAAVAALLIWLYRLTRKKIHPGLLVSLSLIIAGASGNIIDSAFYGMIFNESTYMQVAGIFPPEGGYSSFLHGKVVDMLYFPVVNTVYPSWVPYLGGDDLVFFRPVFNIADSAITIGVFILILFQKKFFADKSAT